MSIKYKDNRSKQIVSLADNDSESSRGKMSRRTTNPTLYAQWLAKD